MRKVLSIILSVLLVVLMVAGALPISAHEIGPLTVIRLYEGENDLPEELQVIYLLKGDLEPYSFKINHFPGNNFFSVYRGDIEAEDIIGVKINDISYAFEAENVNHPTIEPTESDIELLETKETEVKDFDPTIFDDIRIKLGAPLTDYVVKYLNTKDNSAIRPQKTVTGVESGTTVTELAENIENYSVDAESKSLELALTGNEIIFYYTAIPTSYVVKYLNKADNSVLIHEKLVTGQTIGATITENAIALDGYTADQNAKTLLLKAKDNAIIFYYSKVIKDESIPNTGSPDFSAVIYIASLVGSAVSIAAKRRK